MDQHIPIIRLVQGSSRHRLHILHSLELPLESSTKQRGEDGLADSGVCPIDLEGPQSRPQGGASHSSHVEGSDDIRKRDGFWESSLKKACFHGLMPRKAAANGLLTVPTIGLVEWIQPRSFWGAAVACGSPCWESPCLHHRIFWGQSSRASMQTLSARAIGNKAERCRHLSSVIRQHVFNISNLSYGTAEGKASQCCPHTSAGQPQVAEHHPKPHHPAAQFRRLQQQ